jgi:hypothetical protein
VGIAVLVFRGDGRRDRGRGVDLSKIRVSVSRQFAGFAGNHAASHATDNERMKQLQRIKYSYVMHARKGNGPEMHWNGKSFSSDKNVPLHFFSRAATARREGKKLLAKFPVLQDYKIYVSPITHFEKTPGPHLRGGARYRQMRGGSKAPKTNPARKFPSYTTKDLEKFVAEGRGTPEIVQEIADRKSGLSQVRVTPQIAPFGSKPKKNPSALTNAELDTAARKLEDFTGHKVGHLESGYSRSNQHTGLIIGELDLVGYRATRDGKTERYGHHFKKNSRPLLAVTSDGKQLHIVGGQYEFTEAGIEDR